MIWRSRLAACCSGGVGSGTTGRFVAQTTLGLYVHRKLSRPILRGWAQVMGSSYSIPHVLRCFLRPSLTEAPSLRRSYPASSVVRTSPPPQQPLPVSTGLAHSLELKMKRYGSPPSSVPRPCLQAITTATERARFLVKRVHSGPATQLPPCPRAADRSASRYFQLDTNSLKRNNASGTGSGFQRGLQPEVAVSVLTPHHRRFVRAVVSSRIFKSNHRSAKYVHENRNEIDFGDCRYVVSRVVIGNVSSPSGAGGS